MAKAATTTTNKKTRNTGNQHDGATGRYEHRIAVHFGSTSFSKKTVRLPVKIERGGSTGLRDALANRLLLNSLLDCEVRFDAAKRDDADGQQIMDGCEGTKVVAMQASSLRYSKSTDFFSATLVAAKDSIDANVLKAFPGQTGEVLCKKIGTAEGADSAEEDEEGDGEGE